MRPNLSSLFLAAGILTASVSAMAQAPASQPATRTGRITLNLEGATAEESFDQIAKQAGVDLIVDNPSIWAQADLVFINVKDAAFWPTFMQLCQQSRISFDQNNYNNQGAGTRAIHLTNSRNGESPYAKLPSAEADGFMVYAQSAQRNYNLSYDNPQNTNSSFSVQLMVLSDPATPLQQMQQPTVTEAVDENGTSLLPINRNRDGNNYNGGYYGGRTDTLAQQTALSLNYPANAGKKIAKLKGYLRGTAVTKVEQIEIADVLAMKEPLKKAFGEYDMTLYPAKAAGDGNDANNKNKRYEFRLSLHKKEKPQGTGGIRRENRDPNNLVNGMVVTDAEGKRYNCNLNNINNSDTGIEYTMQLYPQQQGIGAPQKLSWRMAAETKEIRVPFELKDMQIP